MNRDTIVDYLGRSGMDASQAEVLSRILADMEGRLATKEDFATLKEDLTWRMFAMFSFFGTVITLLNAFIS